MKVFIFYSLLLRLMNIIKYVHKSDGLVKNKKSLKIKEGQLLFFNFFCLKRMLVFNRSYYRQKTFFDHENNRMVLDSILSVIKNVNTCRFRQSQKYIIRNICNILLYGIGFYP